MSDNIFEPYYQITYHQAEGYHVRYTSGLGSTTLGEAYKNLQAAKSRAVRHYEKRFSKPVDKLEWKDLGEGYWQARLGGTQNG